MKKSITLFFAAMLLLNMMFFANAAEPAKLYFTSKQSTSFTDGGWYAKGDTESLKASGTNGIEITGANRVLWAFTNDIIEANPYLYIKGGENFSSISKITVSRYWDVEPELTLELKSGENVINIAELLTDQETIGYTYVVVYINGTASIEYMCLSNAGADGKVYEKPVQPTVPNGDSSKEIRFQLSSYEQENKDENGYGWLMSPDVKVTPDKKGFAMQRKEGSTAAAFNIAWVVKYEQLEKTPYLVLDMGNEGRADEGPRVDVFAYWEGVVGSYAKFDLVPKTIGANSLNGVTKLPLKYAVDNVKESLHGDKGIAIIISVTVDERTDATSLEPLIVKDAYLLGYTEGGELVSNTVSESISSEIPSSSSQMQEPKGKENKIQLFIIIIIAVVLTAGVIAALVIVNKRKRQ